LKNPHASIAILISILSFALVGSAAGQSSAQLGSLDYKPSPEHPVGWRGDWTGRFPGATPPIQWSRRVKGITTELCYQADKPADTATGKPSAAAKQLEYFTIKDWLVAGPFGVDDPAEDINRDFLGGEATVEPSSGAKAGTSIWRPLRADVATQSRHECNEGSCAQSNVDFVYVFGTAAGIDLSQRNPIPSLNKQAGYAHTYIYSPATGSVRLQFPFAGVAGRFWLNGKPTDLERRNPGRTYDAMLTAGWNRLLVKITVDTCTSTGFMNAQTSKWLVAGYIMPTFPVSYETENVNWMTKMTGRSMSQPIVVGDKIFIGSGISDLMCLDKKSGKVLWLHSNTPYDALSAKEKAAIPEIGEKIEPLVARLDARNDAMVAAINAAVSSVGLSSPQQAVVDAVIKAKIVAEQAVQNAFRSIDRKKFPPFYTNEVSSGNGTPCSDGKFVYWACGGGTNGVGAYVVSCFSLSGERIWSRYDSSFGVMEHGNHSSLAILHGKVILAANKTLAAYDAKSGAELWRNTPPDWTNELCVTPVPASIGRTDIIIGNRNIHRVSDGSVLCPAGDINEIFSSMLTPIVDHGIIYAPGQSRGEDKPMGFVAVELPASDRPGVKCQTLWAPDGKDVDMPERGRNFMIASPLDVQGLIYFVGMSGGLAVVDPANRKSVYRQWLDGYDRYNRSTYGVCASPTMAGKAENIYITDDAGFTHVIPPGKTFTEIGRNVLENIHESGVGGNPCRQESFYTSPAFDGQLMFLRGEEYLYCIGGNSPATAR
jgi:outer membrane protein assembly factor BamB